MNEPDELDAALTPEFLQYVAEGTKSDEITTFYHPSLDRMMLVMTGAQLGAILRDWGPSEPAPSC
jgi:hypothetical protein